MSVSSLTTNQNPMQPPYQESVRKSVRMFRT